MSAGSENLGRCAAGMASLCRCGDARLRCLEVTELDQFVLHARDRRSEILGAGIERQLRRYRRLVRIADPGELADLARERLLVEALRVALDALLERGRDV